jgi:hypothetical protein
MWDFRKSSFWAMEAVAVGMTYSANLNLAYSMLNTTMSTFGSSTSYPTIWTMTLTRIAALIWYAWFMKDFSFSEIQASWEGVCNRNDSKTVENVRKHFQ